MRGPAHMIHLGARDRRIHRTAMAAAMLAAGLTVAGCGKSNPGPKTRAAACAIAQGEAQSLRQRSRSHGEVLVISGNNSGLDRIKALAAGEAKIDREAIAGIEQLPQTRATRTALRNLEGHVRALVRESHQEAEALPLLMAGQGGCANLPEIGG